MMNTKVYKAVHTLAKQLMQAVYEKNDKAFAKYYQNLDALCQEHDNSDKDHPVQWETLADFTDDFEQALMLYSKALTKAKAIDAKDYAASILYAKACLHIELEQTTQAITELEEAKVFANKIEDKQLKQEINTLLQSHS